MLLCAYSFLAISKIKTKYFYNYRIGTYLPWYSLHFWFITCIKNLWKMSPFFRMHKVNKRYHKSLKKIYIYHLLECTIFIKIAAKPIFLENRETSLIEIKNLSFWSRANKSFRWKPNQTFFQDLQLRLLSLVPWNPLTSQTSILETFYSFTKHNFPSRTVHT